MVEFDLLQVGLNAFAAAFGMGIANEIYHAFRDYRKKLKERLLDDTIVAIRYYRELRARQRLEQVKRFARCRYPILYTETTATPVVPTPPIPSSHRIALLADKIENVKREPVLNEKVENVKREPTLTHLTYGPPPTIRKRDDSIDEPLRRMVEWER